MAISLERFNFGDLLEKDDGWVPKNPLYDVQFQILDELGEIAGEIKCHKLLLSFVSPVFRNLFFHTGKPRNVVVEGDIEQIEIKGYSLVGFRSLIRYLYSGEEEGFMNLELDDLFQLFMLADKYQVRGLKQLVRVYIQKADISSYTDAFKVLAKYDDHFILEVVSADCYRKCAKSIIKKCTLDNLDMTSYVEEIIGEDLEMKNVSRKKLMKECTALNEKANEEATAVKTQLDDIKANLGPVKKRFFPTKKTDKDELLKRSFLVLEKLAVGPEKESVKCLNCRSSMVKCKSGEGLNHLYKGMKVSSHGHACHVFPGPPAQAQTLHVPWGTIGTMDKSFGIVWSQGNKKVICNCNKTTSTYEKIVYYC